MFVSPQELFIFVFRSLEIFSKKFLVMLITSKSRFVSLIIQRTVLFIFERLDTGNYKH